MRGGLGSYASMLLEILIACQRWGVLLTSSVPQIASKSVTSSSLVFILLCIGVSADHSLLGEEVLQGVEK